MASSSDVMEFLSDKVWQVLQLNVDIKAMAEKTNFMDTKLFEERAAVRKELKINTPGTVPTMDYYRNLLQNNGGSLNISEQVGYAMALDRELHRLESGYYNKRGQDIDVNIEIPKLVKHMEGLLGQRAFRKRKQSIMNEETRSTDNSHPYEQRKRKPNMQSDVQQKSRRLDQDHVNLSLHGDLIRAMQSPEQLIAVIEREGIGMSALMRRLGYVDPNVMDKLLSNYESTSSAICDQFEILFQKYSLTELEPFLVATRHMHRSAIHGSATLEQVFGRRATEVIVNHLSDQIKWIRQIYSKEKPKAVTVESSTLNSGEELLRYIENHGIGLHIKLPRRPGYTIVDELTSASTIVKRMYVAHYREWVNKLSYEDLLTAQTELEKVRDAFTYLKAQVERILGPDKTYNIGRNIECQTKTVLHSDVLELKKLHGPEHVVYADASVAESTPDKAEKSKVEKKAEARKLADESEEILRKRFREMETERMVKETLSKISSVRQLSHIIKGDGLSLNKNIVAKFYEGYEEPGKRFVDDVICRNVYFKRNYINEYKIIVNSMPSHELNVHGRVLSHAIDLYKRGIPEIEEIFGKQHAFLLNNIEDLCHIVNHGLKMKTRKGDDFVPYGDLNEPELDIATEFNERILCAESLIPDWFKAIFKNEMEVSTSDEDEYDKGSEILKRIFLIKFAVGIGPSLLKRLISLSPKTVDYIHSNGKLLDILEETVEDMDDREFAYAMEELLFVFEDSVVISGFNITAIGGQMDAFKKYVQHQLNLIKSRVKRIGLFYERKRHKLKDYEEMLKTVTPCWIRDKFDQDQHVPDQLRSKIDSLHCIRNKVGLTPRVLQRLKEMGLHAFHERCVKYKAMDKHLNTVYDDVIADIVEEAATGLNIETIIKYTKELEDANEDYALDVLSRSSMMVREFVLRVRAFLFLQYRVLVKRGRALGVIEFSNERVFDAFKKIPEMAAVDDATRLIQMNGDSPSNDTEQRINMKLQLLHGKEIPTWVMKLPEEGLCLGDDFIELSNETKGPKLHFQWNTAIEMLRVYNCVALGPYLLLEKLKLGMRKLEIMANNNDKDMEEVNRKFMSSICERLSMYMLMELLRELDFIFWRRELCDTVKMKLVDIKRLYEVVMGSLKRQRNFLVQYLNEQHGVMAHRLVIGDDETSLAKVVANAHWTCILDMPANSNVNEYINIEVAPKVHAAMGPAQHLSFEELPEPEWFQLLGVDQWRRQADGHGLVLEETARLKYNTGLFRDLKAILMCLGEYSFVNLKRNVTGNLDPCKEVLRIIAKEKSVPDLLECARQIAVAIKHPVMAKLEKYENAKVKGLIRVDLLYQKRVVVAELVQRSKDVARNNDIEDILPFLDFTESLKDILQNDQMYITKLLHKMDKSIDRKGYMVPTWFYTWKLENGSPRQREGMYLNGLLSLKYNSGLGPAIKQTLQTTNRSTFYEVLSQPSALRDPRIKTVIYNILREEANKLTTISQVDLCLCDVMDALASTELAKAKQEDETAALAIEEFFRKQCELLRGRLPTIDPLYVFDYHAAVDTFVTKQSRVRQLAAADSSTDSRTNPIHRPTAASVTAKKSSKDEALDASIAHEEPHLAVIDIPEPLKSTMTRNAQIELKLARIDLMTSLKLQKNDEEVQAAWRKAVVLCRKYQELVISNWIEISPKFDEGAVTLGDVDHVKQFHSYCKLYPADEPLWNMSNLYASLRDIHTYKKAISDFMDACHIRATGSKVSEQSKLPTSTTTSKTRACQFGDDSSPEKDTNSAMNSTMDEAMKRASKILGQASIVLDVPVSNNAASTTSIESSFTGSSAEVVPLMAKPAIVTPYSTAITEDDGYGYEGFHGDRPQYFGWRTDVSTATPTFPITQASSAPSYKSERISRFDQRQPSAVYSSAGRGPAASSSRGRDGSASSSRDRRLGGADARSSGTSRGYSVRDREPRRDAARRNDGRYDDRSRNTRDQGGRDPRSRDHRDRGVTHGRGSRSGRDSRGNERGGGRGRGTGRGRGSGGRESGRGPERQAQEPSISPWAMQLQDQTALYTDFAVTKPSTKPLAPTVDQTAALDYGAAYLAKPAGDGNSGNQMNSTSSDAGGVKLNRKARRAALQKSNQQASNPSAAQENSPQQAQAVAAANNESRKQLMGVGAMLAHLTKS